MTAVAPRRSPPGPRGYFLVRNGPTLVRGPLDAFVAGWREYGDIVRFRLPGSLSLYLLAHPDHIKHVLADHHQNYPKDPRTGRKFKSFIGEGLFTSEGALWLRQRRLSQPAFHRQRLADFGAIMTASAAAMVEDWRSSAERGEPVEVLSEMMRLALTIVAQVLFSADVRGEAETVARTVTLVNNHVNSRLQSFVDIQEKLPLPSNRRFLAARQSLDEVVYRLINERRRSGEETGDLLSMLLAARDEETGEGMSDQQLRDEILTIFLAGYETTGIALTWTFHLLSMNPTAARRLQAEFAAVLGGRLPTVDDLPNLRYSSMVIQEAMRLFPPAWTVFRTPIKDDTIGGYHIEAGNQVYLSPFIAHRHPAFWDNPEGFDPERFTPEQSAGRPRYAYCPFGGGPRQCIGNNLALMEMQLILATVLQTYRLDMVPGHPVALQTKIFLHPRHGMRMTLHPAERVAVAPVGEAEVTA